MKSISDYIINADMKIVDAIRKIDNNGRGIAFVCDGFKLRGVLSDGDVRRFLMQGGNLENPVSKVANFSPRSVRKGQAIDLKKYISDNRITAVPVIDENGLIVEIKFKEGDEVKDRITLGIPVVIMAGGKGTRLQPYTQILPKPLIPIGDKTITEHIIDRFAEFGCTDITMIVNYKKKFIETYFLDGSMGNIKFVEEESYRGTGGGLSLLQGVKERFFMTNCDILLNADYSSILEQHLSERNIITLVCARKKYEIPYGIVEKDLDKDSVVLKEKPTYSFLANTGFYLIEPRFLDKIPKDAFVHITDVITKCIEEGENVGVYEIEGDDWMDMGQIDELERMRQRIGSKRT